MTWTEDRAMNDTMYRLDDHAYLTTEHTGSSYGQPVLIDDRYHGPRAANDHLHPDTTMTGCAYVGAYYRVGDVLPDLVRRYLSLASRPTDAHARTLLSGLITEAQIEALRQEAGEAGDTEQVAICDRAQEGDEDALTECSRVISAARAMLDEDDLDAPQLDPLD